MLNQWAQQVSQMSMMLPPAIGQLRGLHVALTGVDFAPPQNEIEGSAGAPSKPESPGARLPEGESQPEKPAAVAEGEMTAPPMDPQTPFAAAPPVTLEGFFFVASAAPVQLLEGLKLFRPELRDLTLNPDGTPQPLQNVPGASFLSNPHIVMTQYGIGVSSGEGAQTTAADALAEEPSGDTPLLFLRYDLAGLKPLMDMGPPSATQMIKPILDQGPGSISVTPEDRGIFVDMNYRWARETP